MTLADSLKPLLYANRALPGTLGLRPYSVAILIGTWSGTYTGRGGTIDEIVAITESGGQPPKVRQLSAEDLALSGLGKGSLRIGPITTGYTGGGTALDDLKPAVAAGQTVHAMVTLPAYPNGAKFLIKSIDTTHALHWTMDVEPVSEIGP